MEFMALIAFLNSDAATVCFCDITHAVWTVRMRVRGRGCVAVGVAAAVAVRDRTFIPPDVALGSGGSSERRDSPVERRH